VSAAPAVAALVKDIQARGDALSSGALGTRYVFRALVDHGQWAVAMALATKTTSPSFGYMVAQGPGTIWEEWAGDATHARGSKNHPMFCGGIGLFLYELAGLRQARWPYSFEVPVEVARTIGSASLSLGPPSSSLPSWSWAVLSGNLFAANLTLQYESTRVNLPRLSPGCDSSARLVEHRRGLRLHLECAADTTQMGGLASELEVSPTTVSLVLDPGEYHFELA